MKKLVLLAILAVSFCSFSQSLPEIPLKNGIAYFSFTHKLNNTKKCISSYFDAPLIDQPLLPLQQKIIYETSQFGYKQAKNSVEGIKNFSINIKRELRNLDCIDTVKYGASNFIVSLKDEILWRPHFLGKKVLNQKFTANIGVVFLSKNEYKLIITDIQYSFITAQGFKGVMEVYKLGEYYEDLKKNKKVSKDDIEFINYITELMKKADDVILKALSDTFSVDEL